MLTCILQVSIFQFVDMDTLLNYNKKVLLTECEECLMNKTFDSRLMLIFSMIIFGTLGPFVRNISVSSGELALYRAVLAALLISSCNGNKLDFAI